MRLLVDCVLFGWTVVFLLDEDGSRKVNIHRYLMRACRPEIYWMSSGVANSHSNSLYSVKDLR